MPRIITFAAAACLSAALLTACDEAPYSTVTQDMSAGSEVWERMTVATAKGPLMLEVYGDQAYDDGMLIDRLPGLIAGAVEGRRIEMTVNPDAATHPHIRVVFVANMAAEAGSAILCRRDPDQQPAGANATFRMAFCAGDKYMRGVKGEMLQGQGSDSADFPKLVAQMADELLKRRTSSER